MRGKTVLFALLTLALALLLVACGGPAETEPPAQQDTPVAGDAVAGETPEAAEPDGGDGDANAYEGLMEELRAAGVEVELGDNLSQPFFEPEAQIIRVNGQDVQVFDIGDEAAAAEVAATVSEDGTVVGTTAVDWVEPPHFYRKGGLIVLYVGSDEAVTGALADVLGQPFATGSGIGEGGAPATGEPPVSHGGDVTGYVSLVDALRAAGAQVEAGDTLSQPFFDPQAQVISVDGQDVQVFEFADAAAASAAAGTVSADGTSVGTSMMTWMDTPHFFRVEKLILLYVGSDQATLELLQEVAGPQFAGG